MGEEHDRDELLRKLIDTQYVRNDTLLGRGRFRVKGDVIEVQPASAETAYRISLFGDEVEQITHFDPLTGEVYAKLDNLTIFPATQYDWMARLLGIDPSAALALDGVHAVFTAADLNPGVHELWYSMIGKEIRGVTEETTTGVHGLHHMAKNKRLLIPAINVKD